MLFSAFIALLARVLVMGENSYKRDKFPSQEILITPFSITFPPKTHTRLSRKEYTRRAWLIRWVMRVPSSFILADSWTLSLQFHPLKILASNNMKTGSIISIAAVVLSVFAVGGTDAVCHSCGTPVCSVPQSIFCMFFGGVGSTTACRIGQWDCKN